MGLAGLAGVSAPGLAATPGAVGMEQGTIIGLVAGIWLVLAAWAVTRSVRWASEARRSNLSNTRLKALLAAAPATYLLMTRDLKLSASAPLADMLGLSGELRTVDDLHALAHRFHKDDVDALIAGMTSLPVGGRPFARLLRATADGSILRAEGRLPSAELVGESGAVIWFSDVTHGQGERDRLGERMDQMKVALEAISSLIEAAPFPIWHRQKSGTLALVNTAYVRAVEGQNATDVVVRGAELFEDGLGTGPRAAAEEAQKQGRPLVRTAPAIVAGERRMFRVFDVPLGDAGVAGFAFDVEDLEQTRAELVRFSRAQRDTLDRLSAGVAQFAADRTLVFFNQPFARIFALEPEWLADGPEFDRVLERMREYRRLPEQRDFLSWRNERREWFTTAVDAIEETWALPEGSHLRVLAQPHPDGGLLVIFEDRTEQFRLASSRDTLLRVQAATLDNLFEAVCVFAANGRLQLWNARFADMWGVTTEYLQEHSTIDELVPVAASVFAQPERAEMLRHFVRSATTDRRLRSGRFSLQDGRHLEFAAVPLPDGNALFTMLDITDSRRIEAALRDRNEALEAADRLKSAFVANMSYELRTPLTSILGFAEMLSAGYVGELSGGQRDYLSSILDAAGRLQGLIDNLLDLAISDAGAMELETETIDVAQLVNGSIADKNKAVAEKGLDLSVVVEDGTGMVRGDRKRLGSAISHLLANAIQFTPEGGRVMVHASGGADEVSVTVSDSGVGIAPDKQEAVFNPFNRADEGVGSSIGGLGLALVRRYASLHGGVVALHSELGRGTTVTMRIPRNHADGRLPS